MNVEATCSSSFEGIFIESWAPETNLKTESQNQLQKWGSNPNDHKILTTFDLEDSS